MWCDICCCSTKMPSKNGKCLRDDIMCIAIHRLWDMAKGPIYIFGQLLTKEKALSDMLWYKVALAKIKTVSNNALFYSKVKTSGKGHGHRPESPIHLIDQNFREVLFSAVFGCSFLDCPFVFGFQSNVFDFLVSDHDPFCLTSSMVIRKSYLC